MTKVGDRAAGYGRGHPGDAEENRKLVERYAIRCLVLLQNEMEVAAKFRAQGTPMGYRIDGAGRIASELVEGGSKWRRRAGENGGADCRYFSGAPFLFGDGSVMKFSATPVDAPAEPQPNVADPNYLRNALIERLAVREGSKPVVFKFQVQRRDASSLNVAEDIENVCNEWLDSKFEFVTVATLSIPPQDFDHFGANLTEGLLALRAFLCSSSLFRHLSASPFFSHAS